MIGRVVDTPFLALVRREFLVSLRTTRAFFLIALAVVLCIIPTAALFPVDMSDARNSGEILFMLIGFLFAASALIVPGLSAAAVSVEREAETFDLLMMSTVTPTGVLVAKFLNAVGFFVLVIVAVLPVLSTVMFLAGVEVGLLLYAFFMLLVFTVTLACYGLLCSVIFRRTFTAMMASYVSMIMVSGGGVLFMMMVSAVVFYLIPNMLGIYDSSRFVESTSEFMMAIGVPWAGVLEDSVFIEIGYYIESSGLGTYLAEDVIEVLALLPPMIYMFFCGLFALFVARYFLPRDVHPRAEVGEKVIDDTVELDRRRKRFPFYLIDPAKRKKLIEDGRNPVMVKEIRWGALGSITIYIRVFYLTFLLFGAVNSVVWVGSSSDITEMLMFTFVLQTAVSCAIAPALMANTLTKEIETGNLDLLRSTLLDSPSIVRGKWAACAVAACPVTVSALICNLPFMLSPSVWRSYGDILFTGTILLILSTLFVMNIAFFTSSFAKSTAMAVVMGYGVGLAVMLVVPMIISVVVFAYFQSNEQFYLVLTTFMSPPIGYVAAFEEFRVYRYYRDEEPREWIFYAYWAASMAYMMLASVALFVATQRQFAKRMAQGEQ